jgi:RNA polymerase sigma-70 factor (ECF subfamily)
MTTESVRIRTGGVSVCRPAPGTSLAATQPYESDEELTARFMRDAIPLLDQLYRGAYRMTSRHADAEDLLQDTMLKAYAQFRSFRQGIHLKAWMFRIMYNTWIGTYHRRLRRPGECLGVELTDWQLEIYGPHAPMGVRSAEEKALEALPDREITQAFETLPETLRMVVYYADVEGFRYKEIAEILDIPIGTVMSRLYRARLLLQTPLADVARVRGFTPREEPTKTVEEQMI